MTYDFALGWEADWFYAGPFMVECGHYDPNGGGNYRMDHVGAHACDGCCDA